jgi:Aldehyde ferredoxin oxidoreductase, N-terminal domain
MEYLSSNKIAIIDLGTKEIVEEELDEELVKEHIGGAGITTALFEKYKAGEPVVLGTGLLTGTLVPGSALGIMTAQSPRTGTVCHAPLTLYAGMELKYSGFDYLVIKGRSQQPVYLWLHDGIADLEPAEGLWGKNVWEALEGVRKTVGDDLVQALVIGRAGEQGSDLAQVSINYWASGDRWGFGKLLGEKKVKLVAVRGMGLLEISDPEGLVNRCQELLQRIKQGSWKDKQGVADLLIALGEGDAKEWLGPLVHRHKSCFNTPYAANSFVFIDEDPTLMKETEKEEPGFLITDLYGLLGFKKLGLTAADACRALKECAKEGLDAVAVSEICAQRGLKDGNGIQQALSDMKGPAVSAGDGPFSSWAPPQPIFAEFGPDAGGSQQATWWRRRQALAYLFGIDPIFALMAPELGEGELLELANLGTGLGFTQEGLDQAISRLVG